MWSKTKQVLESRLPDGLKGRVSYREMDEHFASWSTKLGENLQTGDV